MKVFVKLVAQVAGEVDKPEFWVFLEDGSTLKDLLQKLEAEKGIKVDFSKKDVVILINGRSVEFLGGIEAKLKDMDRVIIMPVAAGG
ncbi:MAG: Uncharacterized protein XD43_1753 [Thermococcales archaeon 44_46]|uniref:MoaD/ThiS family protein n=1 Tax=Thermococcus TaxID=2263 RepID=UPI000694F770|nr:MULTISPECIES: MoaD/ThiS family protein [Thermococcus]KUJ98581.1 MAG: Uncharacterized protein XD43_1753 [Thermococcales archaeon 44_46]MCA6214758.1 MoaD/ThiS family protein [Thermococcus bergensis]MDK2982705.1 sulfur-carrier protein [Thermococcaceae archaeon]MPW39546.1 hypothetical protein [Thermococcus sp. 101 C5]